MSYTKPINIFDMFPCIFPNEFSPFDHMFPCQVSTLVGFPEKKRVKYLLDFGFA
jgi:hypothetical protein